MVQWLNGSMAQWLNGSMAQWLNGSMAQWLSASESPAFANELPVLREVVGVPPTTGGGMQG